MSSREAVQELLADTIAMLTNLGIRDPLKESPTLLGALILWSVLDRILTEMNRNTLATYRAK